MLSPKRFLPSDCAAGQKFTIAMVFAAFCIVAAFLAGMYTAFNIAGVVVMLFLAAMFGWFAYIGFVSFAQTLQVYYLWRRSNMR